MDELWQLKSACPNRPSSQLFPLPVSLNQTEAGVEPCMHPYVAQEVCVIERTIRQEPVASNMSNLSCQSAHPKAGWQDFSNSLLASWSGTSQQLGSVFQQIPASREQLYSASSSNAPNAGSWRGNFSSLGQDAGLLAVQTAIWSHGAQGRDLSQMMRTVQDNVESAILRSNGLDTCKHAVSVSNHAIEPDLQSHPAVLPWLIDERHPRGERIQAKQRFSLQKYTQPVLEGSFGLNNQQPSGTPLSKPRVYCPSLSGSLIGGELILTETGRLGVLCLCHNLSMSVAKFSEHAGLLTDNPGSIVQMEGGESLVQWRKMFFSRFKVKVPEDHLGWDWNDVSSLEMGHMSQKTVLAQNCHKDIGFCFQEDSSVVKNQASQLWDMSVALRNSWSTGNATLKAGSYAMSPGQKTILSENALKPFGQSFKEDTEIHLTPTQLFLNNIYGKTSRHEDAAVNSPLQGNDVKGSSVNECIEFMKKRNKSYMPETNASLAFPREDLKMSTGFSCWSHDQDAIRLGKGIRTSNFELRLGQPSQQALSVGSLLRSGESARSAVAINQILEHKSQRSSQPSSSSGREGYTGDGGIGQNGGDLHNLHCHNRANMSGELQIKDVHSGNTEDCRATAASNQMQPFILCDADIPSMFTDVCKGLEGLKQVRNKMNSAAACLLSKSSGVQQLFENRDIDEHSRVGVSNLDQEKLVNQIRNNSSAESADVLGSAQTQGSVLHVEPRVEKSDCIKSAVSSYFPPHLTLSDKLSVSLTGPAERESSTLESVAIKNNGNLPPTSSSRSCDGSQQTAQIKRGAHGATSEGLSASSWNQLQEHTSVRILQMTGKGHDQQVKVSVDASKLDAAGQNLSGSIADVSNVSTTLMQANKSSNCQDLYRLEGIKEKKDLSNISHGAVAKPVLEKHHSVQGKSVLQFENVDTCNSAHLGENDPADQCQFQSEKTLPYCKDGEQEGQTLVIGDKCMDRDIHGKECKFMENHRYNNLASATIRAFSKESGCKELICNDIVDEGSGIGKCSSSGDTEISARAKVEHGSADIHPKMQESPTCLGCPVRSVRPCPVKSVRPTFNDLSKTGKPMEKKNMTKKLPADSGAKELCCSDSVDEGSSVGKGCSSDEVDMDVRPSVMPVAMGEHEPVWDSPPFVAWPSSGDAKTSQTLRNTCHVSKLRGSRTAVMRQELIIEKSDHARGKIERRRKAMKWKRLDIASPSELSRQNDSVGLDDISAAGSFLWFHDLQEGRKVLVPDTCAVPFEKSLKRKRSGMKKKSASKPVQERLETDRKAYLKLKGAKHISEEKGRKLAMKLSRGSNEQLMSIDRVDIHEKFLGSSRFVNSRGMMTKTEKDQTCSGVESTFSLGKKYMVTSNIKHEEKAREVSNSDATVKGGRSFFGRKNSKTVKMALLSDILKLPGEEKGSQCRQKPIIKGIKKAALDVPTKNTRDFPIAKTQCIRGSGLRDRINLATTGRDVRKRSLWELTAKGSCHPSTSQVDLVDSAIHSTAIRAVLTEHRDLGYGKSDGKKWHVIREGVSPSILTCQTKDGVGVTIGSDTVHCSAKRTIQLNSKSHKCGTVFENLYVPDKRIDAESIKKMSDFKIPPKLRKKKRNASEALTNKSVGFYSHGSDHVKSSLKFSKKLKSQDNHFKMDHDQIMQSISRGFLPSVEHFGIKWDKENVKCAESDGRLKSVPYRKLKKVQSNLESSDQTDCCVCGSSSSEFTNSLVQCSRCHIKVNKCETCGYMEHTL